MIGQSCAGSTKRACSTWMARGQVELLRLAEVYTLSNTIGYCTEKETPSQDYLPPPNKVDKACFITLPDLKFAYFDQRTLPLPLALHVDCSFPRSTSSSM